MEVKKLQESKIQELTKLIVQGKMNLLRKVSIQPQQSKTTVCTADEVLVYLAYVKYTEL